MQMTRHRGSPSPCKLVTARCDRYFLFFFFSHSAFRHRHGRRWTSTLSHRSLLMDWPNNSRIARRPPISGRQLLPSRRSVTRPHFSFVFFFYYFPFSLSLSLSLSLFLSFVSFRFVSFPDTSDTALWLRPFRSCQLIATNIRWRPRQRHDGMNIHLPFVKKAFAVAKGFEA